MRSEGTSFKKGKDIPRKLLKDTLETCLHDLNAPPFLAWFSSFPAIYIHTCTHIYTYLLSLAHTDSCAQTCNTPFFYRKVTYMKIKLIKAENASKRILSLFL